jgi:hypothetical protein
LLQSLKLLDTLRWLWTCRSRSWSWVAWCLLRTMQWTITSQSATARFWLISSTLTSLRDAIIINWNPSPSHLLKRTNHQSQFHKDNWAILYPKIEDVDTLVMERIVWDYYRASRGRCASSPGMNWRKRGTSLKALNQYFKTFPNHHLANTKAEPNWAIFSPPSIMTTKKASLPHSPSTQNLNRLAVHQSPTPPSAYLLDQSWQQRHCLRAQPRHPVFSLWEPTVLAK